MRDLVKAQRCLRRLVIAYNVFFWVTGPGIVGLGAWEYVVLDEYEPLLRRQDFVGPAYIIIVAGCASVLVGIVGCLGGVNEHRRLLNAYFLLMFIVCSLEISATVYSFLLYDDMDATIKSSVKEVMSDFRLAKSEAVDGMDYVQRQFSCCGIDEPKDWLPPTFTPSNVSDISMTTVPISCCPETIIPERCTIHTSSPQEYCVYVIFRPWGSMNEYHQELRRKTCDRLASCPGGDLFRVMLQRPR